MSFNEAQFPSQVWDGSSPTRPDRFRDRKADTEDWEQITAEMIAVQEFLIDGASPGEAGSEEVAVANIANRVNQTTLTITALDVAITDADAAGAHGTAVLLTLPEGNILILGGVCNLALVNDDTGVDQDAEVVASIGTAAVGVDNATLTSLEANIIPSTAATLTTGEGAAAGASTAVAVVDGTETPATVNLNIAVPATDADGNGVITVDGTVTITWVNLGDI